MRLSVKALLALNRCFPRIEHPFNMQNEGRQTYAEWQFSQGARTLECFLPEMTPADILAGKEVLDMGCGAAGKSLYYVSAGAKHVTGVEMVEHYRAEAEALAAKLGFAQAEDGDGGFARVKETVMAELRATFKPEFVNRIDSTVVFRRLSRADVSAIARRMLEATVQRAAALGVTLTVEDAAVERIADEGFDPLYGARPLRRYIQHTVETLIAKKILAGSILPGVGALVVTGPMLYAQKYAFLAQAREGRGIDLNDLFRGFRDDFGGTLLISLLSGLFIFLWSLLLFIPGIVKAYAYSMVYYVKADHPEYGWRECLDESQRLMTGHKWEKFVLDLSFIGWGIVGSLCLGVGTLWVMTYMAATEAQYYEYLTSGRTSPEF